MDSENKIEMEDSPALPSGFRAAGVHCGVKPAGPDLAIIASDTPCTAAGTFTTNRAAAACVRYCRERLSGKTMRGIVVNSGNANACTGAAGQQDTETMAQIASETLGVHPEEVFVSSTGTIGVPLPMDAIESGIRNAAKELSNSGGAAAARAILTTDTIPKHATTTFPVDGKTVRVTGIAKGAGMIHPNMAPMLCYILTDAAVSKTDLQSLLEVSVGQSFNRICVDGDQSTNDTVLLLANGTVGTPPLQAGTPGWNHFSQGLAAITKELALRIVRDGEGATKLVTVQVSGAASEKDADRVARSIANSLLVKTAWAGNDPNWGRILCAAGYAGVPMELDRIDVFYGTLPAVQGGVSAGTDPAALRAAVEQEAFTVSLDLHSGSDEAVVYACDTTENYVKINSEE